MNVVPIIMVLLVAMPSGCHGSRNITKRIEPVDSFNQMIHSIATSIKQFADALPFNGFGLSKYIDDFVNVLNGFSDQTAGTANMAVNDGILQISKFVVIGADFVDGYAKIVQDAVAEFEPQILVNVLGKSQEEIAQFLKNILAVSDQLRKNAQNALQAAGVKLDDSTSKPTQHTRTTRTPTTKRRSGR